MGGGIRELHTISVSGGVDKRDEVLSADTAVKMQEAEVKSTQKSKVSDCQKVQTFCLHSQII